MDAPDLTDATTYRHTQTDVGDRWHILADGETVIYERRPGEFEPAKIVTASVLVHGDVWTEVER